MLFRSAVAITFQDLTDTTNWKEGKSSEIVFNKVDFSYADRKILDQVSFTIPEKTTTAIVGPSGAGKTTMCNLIARFWDVNAGKITIGGTDVRDFKLDSLMKNISMAVSYTHLDVYKRQSQACSIVPIAAARCMSTAPTMASGFLNMTESGIVDGLSMTKY